MPDLLFARRSPLPLQARTWHEASQIFLRGMADACHAWEPGNMDNHIVPHAGPRPNAPACGRRQMQGRVNACGAGAPPDLRLSASRLHATTPVQPSRGNHARLVPVAPIADEFRSHAIAPPGRPAHMLGSRRPPAVQVRPAYSRHALPRPSEASLSRGVGPLANWWRIGGSAASATSAIRGGSSP